LAIEAVLTLPFLVVRPFPSVDFHSHVYNAWLSHLIEGGELPGLSVAPAWTNAATDRVVAVLLPLLPLRAVETLVLIVLAHLVVWSGFLFCRALAGRGCWESLPVLAAVSLGWSFHMGFTNWLAAASLSLLAGTVVLSRLPIAGQVAMGLPIVTLAAISNPLPLAWIAAAVLLVISLWRPLRRPGFVLAAAVAAVALAGLALRVSGRAIYTDAQWATFSGADQLYVFDDKYRIFTIGLVALWVWGSHAWLRSVGNRAVADPAFAVAAFASACALLLPDSAFFPGYVVNASFLVQRHSLFAAVAWTAVASRGGFSRWRLAAALLLLSGWLAVLATDWRTVSRLADAVAEAAARLPEGSRVISAIRTSRSRVGALNHALSRACVNRCFSWGNYEPATGAFRVRADHGNAFVVSRVSEFAAIEGGRYRVPDLPFPLWRIHPCPHSPATMCASLMTPGEVLRLECLDPFSRPGKAHAVERCTVEEQPE
jgi:hypothetical protein